MVNSNPPLGASPAQGGKKPKVIPYRKRALKGVAFWVGLIALSLSTTVYFGDLGESDFSGFYLVLKWMVGIIVGLPVVIGIAYGLYVLTKLDAKEVKKICWIASVVLVIAGLAAAFVTGLVPVNGVQSWALKYWDQAWGRDVLIILAVFGVLWVLKAKQAAAGLVAVLGVGALLAIHIMPFVGSFDSHGGMPPANDVSSWWKINLPPRQSESGGKSKKIPIPPHMRPLVDIQDARVTCVYGNGKEIAFGVGEAPCPVGDMPFFYVTNTRQTEENVASYTFVPIK